MEFSNITDRFFWDAKYARNNVRYSLHDPFYGRKGLLGKALLPWLKEANNVLELGCGSSRYMMFFNIVAGLKTFGIDFSKEGLWNLKVMAASHGIKHNLFYGDMFEQENPTHSSTVLCYKCVAKKLNDEIICERIKDNYVKSDCYIDIAYVKKDASLCSKVDPNIILNKQYNQELCQ